MPSWDPLPAVVENGLTRRKNLAPPLAFPKGGHLLPALITVL